MTYDPRAQADAISEIQLGDQASAASATSLFSEPPKLTDVAQTLAAHGGGALSIDLALDIVLNDIVEQARNATGATGAAIALVRDSELVCRATSGENAPDLGVRVDAHSGLAGACVRSGEIQLCEDTDVDGRVNAETCRQLGVRSMMIAPLVDGQRLIGILQVFSSWPNAFGKREVTAMQVLAGRIAESNREAETSISTPTLNSNSVVEPAPAPLEPIQQEEHQPLLAVESKAVQSGPRRKTDFIGAILVALVIAAAVVLGLLIGWHKAAELSKQGGPVKTSKAVKLSPVSETPEIQSPSTADPNSAPSSVPVKKAASPTAPLGGLVVTQNGKVVYRSSASTAGAGANASAASPLIHKVDPEYPEQARARQVQGPVVLDVVVLGDGAVGTVVVVSGDPLLTQSAIDAVKQWRYRPEAPDGLGIERHTRVTVNFKLPAS